MPAPIGIGCGALLAKEDFRDNPTIISALDN
jgi:hypothetical protein